MARRTTAPAAPGALHRGPRGGRFSAGSTLKWALLWLAGILLSIGQPLIASAHAVHRAATSDAASAHTVAFAEACATASGAQGHKVCATQRRVSARHCTAQVAEEPSFAAISWPLAPRVDRHAARYRGGLVAPPSVPAFLLVSRLLI